MSDPLSVAASIAGLITIADVVVRKGYHYLRDLKDVEKSAKKLIDEVNVLSGILHSLKNVAEYLESGDYEFNPATQIHYVHSCQKSLKRIQELLDEADPSSTSGARSIKKRLKWPFSKHQSEELLAEIEHHKATMTLAMTADEMSTLLELLRRSNVLQHKVDGIHTSVLEMAASQQRVIAEEDKRKMLQYLGKLNPETWQRTNLALRQPGTGIWFTDGSDFRTWLSTENSKLWIYGIPGAGKTILISSVIQELSQHISIKQGLAYFYCDYKDPKTHDPVAIFGQLAKHIATQNEGCLQQLASFYAAHIGQDGLERSATPEELCELLKSMTTHLDETMIIVDGLDEIANGRSYATRLLSELSNAPGIKMILSSRPEVDIKRHLLAFNHISIAARSDDLQLYVASEIERRTSSGQLTLGDPSLKEQIMQTLIGKAEGMFRWVSCQMDYLCECSTDRERRNALTKLPPDLPSSYKRILKRVNASTTHNQQMVVQTLQWLIFGKQKLTTPALIEALGCIDNETSFDKECLTTVDQLLHWCSSLVRLSSEGTIEVAHFTVKEFLASIHSEQDPELSKFQIRENMANANLAKACLIYLSYPTFEQLKFPVVMNNVGQELVGRYLEKYEFLAYATVFWDEHARTVLTDRSIFRRVKHFFRPARNRTFAFWKRMRYYIIRCYDDALKFRQEELEGEYSVTQKTNPLHWAAILALPSIYINKVSCFGTPLCCALLQGTEIDKDYDWSTWFEENATWREGDRKMVINLLIAQGAILDKAPFSGDTYTPLATALIGQMYGITELLANAGGKLTFEELQELIEYQLDNDNSWMPPLPSTPIELSKFIVPDENIDEEENIFRIGVLLTIPFVNNENSHIFGDEFSWERESNDGEDLVPECLDVEYKGPISPSTRKVLYDTIKLHARLNSFDTFIALVGMLGLAKASIDEQNSVFQRQVASFLNYYIRYNLWNNGQIVSRILVILEALKIPTTIPIVDDEGNTLMHIALDSKAPPEITDAILRLGINLAITNNAGETLIHLAASKGNLVFLQRFFRDYDCNLTLAMITEDGCCPLSCAVQSGSEETTKYILEKYSAAEEHVIKSVVQNALHHQNMDVLGIMAESDVFAGHLHSERNSTVQPTYEEAEASSISRKPLSLRRAASYHSSAENVADVVLSEDVEMEDVNA